MQLHAAILFIFLLLAPSSDTAGTLRWTPCTADNDEQMPVGYHFECCTTDVPMSHRSSPRTTISFFVKRAVHNAPGNKNIWLLAGGPGEDARQLEVKILPRHARLLEESRPTFYLPHHRGTGHGTAVHSSGNLAQTLFEVSPIKASLSIPLEALNTFEAASDLIAFIASMNESSQKKNVFHGFSYGAYWGLYAASLGGSELVSGLVLDGVLPPAFHIHADRQDHRLNEAIMQSCESDTNGWCQQMTNRQDVLAGIKTMVDKSMHNSNYCISHFVNLFPPENQTVNDLREAFRIMLASEMCILRDHHSSESFVLDTRVMAIQLLTNFARCEDHEAFLRLATVAGLFYQKSKAVHLAFGGLGPPLDLGTVDFSRHRPSRWPQLFRKRNDVMFEGMAASRHRPQSDTGVNIYALTDSLLDEFDESGLSSAKKFSSNYTVFAAVVYQEFWPYDVKLDTADVINDAINGGNETSIWKAMSLSGAPTLARHRSLFPVTAASPMDLRSITMPVVIFSGTLDLRTPQFASQDLFTRLPSSNKHFISLTNQGHVLTSLLSHTTDEQFNLCISTILSGLHSSPSFTPPLECVEPLNRASRLDWHLDRLAPFGYAFWPLQTRSMLAKLRTWVHFLWVVHPLLSLLAIICLVSVGLSFFVLYKWRRARKIAMLANCSAADSHSEEVVDKSRQRCFNKTARSSSVNLPLIAGIAPQPSLHPNNLNCSPTCADRLDGAV